MAITANSERLGNTLQMWFLMVLITGAFGLVNFINHNWSLAVVGLIFFIASTVMLIRADKGSV